MPNTLLINFVDDPATVTFSQIGEGRIVLAASYPILDVTPFRKCCLCVGYTSATSIRVVIGKLSGVTLGQYLDFPVDNNIHRFDIVGPEMAVWLTGGDPNVTEFVQFWAYLTS